MTAALVLTVALLVLLTVTALSIRYDVIWEHVGATEQWSPLSEVGPSVSTVDFAAGTGWPE